VKKYFLVVLIILFSTIVFATGSGLFITQEVNEFQVTGGAAYPYYVYGGVSSLSFWPGETVEVSVGTWGGACSNGLTRVNVYVRNAGGSWIPAIEKDVRLAAGASPSYDYSTTFTVPSTPGSYTVDFNARGVKFDSHLYEGENKYAHINFSVPYTVSALSVCPDQSLYFGVGTGQSCPASNPQDASHPTTNIACNYATYILGACVTSGFSNRPLMGVCCMKDRYDCDAGDICRKTNGASTCLPNERLVGSVSDGTTTCLTNGYNGDAGSCCRIPHDCSAGSTCRYNSCNAGEVVDASNPTCNFGGKICCKVNGMDRCTSGSCYPTAGSGMSPTCPDVYGYIVPSTIDTTPCDLLAIGDQQGICCNDNTPTPTCTSTCSVLNDKKCSGNYVQTCQLGADGCKYWTNTQNCSATGQTCLEGVCVGSVVNGVCGGADGIVFPYNASNFSPYSICSAGTSDPYNVSFPAPGASSSWSCIGSGTGATTDFCSASRAVGPIEGPVDGVCGSIKDDCAEGAFSDVPDSADDYLWDCNGLYGGNADNCSMAISVDSSDLTCADLGLDIVSGAGVVDGNSNLTDVNLFVSCSEHRPNVGVNASIVLNKLEFFGGDGASLGSAVLSVDCNKFGVSVVSADFNSSISGVYSYRLSYFGSQGPDSVNCEKVGSLVSSKPGSLSDVPDSSFVSMILVLVLVLSIILVKRK
jgi:hypothetical protein